MSQPPLRARLHRYLLTPSELALLTAMCEHCSDGSCVWAAVPRLAAYAKLGERTVQRHLRDLCRRGILTVIAPANSHKRRPTTYRINESALTEDPALTRYTAQMRLVPSGHQSGAMVTPVLVPSGHQSGAMVTPNSTAFDSEDDSKARIRGERLSKDERDTLDYKRWRKEMDATEPQAGAYIENLNEHWRRRARNAAELGGVTPRRIAELLKQFHPDDPNIYLLYPNDVKAGRA